MEPRDILIDGGDRITIMTVGQNEPVYVFGVGNSGQPFAEVWNVMIFNGSEARQLAWAVFDCVQFGLTSKYSKAFVKMLNRMDEWDNNDAIT